MGRLYSASASGVALVAATAKTVIEIGGDADVKGKLVEWGVSFDSNSPTATPVLVELIRSSALITGTAVTEGEYEPDDPANQIQALSNASAEGTAGDILERHYVHPTAGMVKQYPLGREPVLDNVATQGLRIRCTAPAGVNAAAYCVWEE